MRKPAPNEWTESEVAKLKALAGRPDGCGATQHKYEFSAVDVERHVTPPVAADDITTLYPLLRCEILNQPRLRMGWTGRAPALNRLEVEWGLRSTRRPVGLKAGKCFPVCPEADFLSGHL